MKVRDKFVGGLLQCGIRASWIPKKRWYFRLCNTLAIPQCNQNCSHNPFFKSLHGIQLALIPNCNKPPIGLSPTFITTVLNPNDELKYSIYFFLVISNYNHGPSRSWSKLNHPTIGERQKEPLSSHELPLMPKALLLCYVFTHSKSIIFIA